MEATAVPFRRGRGESKSLEYGRPRPSSSSSILCLDFEDEGRERRRGGCYVWSLNLNRRSQRSAKSHASVLFAAAVISMTFFYSSSFSSFVLVLVRQGIISPRVQRGRFGCKQKSAKSSKVDECCAFLRGLLFNNRSPSLLLLVGRAEIVPSRTRDENDDEEETNGYPVVGRSTVSRGCGNSASALTGRLTTASVFADGRAHRGRHNSFSHQPSVINHHLYPSLNGHSPCGMPAKTGKRRTRHIFVGGSERFADHSHQARLFT